MPAGFLLPDSHFSLPIFCRLQFEGQVLYSLLDLIGTDAYRYILAAIIAHFAGFYLRPVCQVAGGRQKHDARRHGLYA